MKRAAEGPGYLKKQHLVSSLWGRQSVLWVPRENDA